MSNSTPSGFANTLADASVGQHDIAIRVRDESIGASLRESWGSSIMSYLVDEDGTTAVEYAVMISLIAATCIAGFQTLTTATVDSFQTSADELAD